MTSTALQAAVGSAASSDSLAAVDEALDTLSATLDARPDLAVAFLGAAHGDAADRIAARIIGRLAPRHLLGSTAEAVIAGPREHEDPAALSVWAACLPGASITPLHYPPPAGHGEVGREWSPGPDDAQALVLLGDPFTFPADAFLAWWEQSRPGVPVCGGLASGAVRADQVRLLLDDDLVEGGGVAVALGGVRVRTLVSQGCRPIGESYTVTRAQRNIVQELGGISALQRIRATYAAAQPDDRALMQTGLHIGSAIDEYRDEHTRGDFLIRAILGAESDTGAIAVGDVVEAGQTVRFHVRDAASADEDLQALLADLRSDDTPAAALLFTCNGRGARLFGARDHDARLLSEALGGAPLAGCFCAGELGPVGSRSFLHGFTASVLVLDEA